MFVRTTTGTVFNSDCINEIHEVRDGKRFVQHKAYLSDGSPIGFLDTFEFDALRRIGRVVPAQPNHIAIVVTAMEKDDGDLEAVIDEYPIVAWVISGSEDDPYAHPVLPDSLAANQMLGVLLADNKICVPHDGTFDDKQAFATAFMKDYVSSRTEEARNA